MKQLLKKLGIYIGIASGILFLIASSIFLSVQFHEAMHWMRGFFYGGE